MEVDQCHARGGGGSSRSHEVRAGCGEIWLDEDSGNMSGSAWLGALPETWFMRNSFKKEETYERKLIAARAVREITHRVSGRLIRV